MFSRIKSLINNLRTVGELKPKTVTQPIIGQVYTILDEPDNPFVEAPEHRAKVLDVQNGWVLYEIWLHRIGNRGTRKSRRVQDFLRIYSPWDE